MSIISDIFDELKNIMRIYMNSLDRFYSEYKNPVRTLLNFSDGAIVRKFLKDLQCIRMVFIQIVHLSN